MAFTKIAAAGIGSTELVTLHSLEVLNNATVGGVLTYEDVTNVDSIGIITARAGVLVGSGITLSKDGDIFATGVTTTGSLVSSGAISGTTGTFTGGIDVTSNVTISDSIVHSGDDNTKIRFPAADTITAETGGSEALRIDSSGRLIVGAVSSNNVGGFGGAAFQVEGLTAGTSALSLIRHSANTVGSTILMGKSRGTSDGATTVVQDDDNVARIIAYGADGTDTESSLGAIQFDVDGTPGSNDMPGRIVFSTTPDGAATYTERLRITSGGVKQIKNGNLNIYQTYIDFSGDISTPSTAAAIFRPADNTLAFSTLNAERARIDSGGDFGVGLTNPTAKLHAQDDSATETTILKLRNYASSVNTKPSMSFEASTSSGQGATSTIQGLAGTDAGGSASANDSGMKFIVRHGGSGTERESFSIKTDGNIHFPNGQGIDFSATGDGSGTMSSELLDDYEEGTWTPVLSFGGASTGITYTNRGGNYTKIGRQVTLNFMIELSSKGSSTGDAVIGGLPYAVTDLLPGTIIEASGASSYWNNIDPDLMFFAFSASTGDYLTPRFQPETGASDAVDSLDNSNFTNSTNFRGSITYFA